MADEEEPRCPFCSETRLIERVNDEYVCYVCSRAWKAVNVLDARLLRLFHIDPR